MTATVIACFAAAASEHGRASTLTLAAAACFAVRPTMTLVLNMPIKRGHHSAGTKNTEIPSAGGNCADAGTGFTPPGSSSTAPAVSSSPPQSCGTESAHHGHPPRVIVSNDPATLIASVVPVPRGTRCRCRTGTNSAAWRLRLLLHPPGDAAVSDQIAAPEREQHGSGAGSILLLPRTRGHVADEIQRSAGFRCGPAIS